MCLSYGFWRPPPAGANFEGGKLASLTHTSDSDSGLAGGQTISLTAEDILGRRTPPETVWC